MNFETLTGFGNGQIPNPYAAKLADGTWVTGTTDTAFLNTNFGNYTTATEMKAATTSEGLQMFFGYLAQRGEIPA